MDCTLLHSKLRSLNDLEAIHVILYEIVSSIRYRRLLIKRTERD